MQKNKKKSRPTITNINFLKPHCLLVFKLFYDKYLIFTFKKKQTSFLFLFSKFAFKKENEKDIKTVKLMGFIWTGLSLQITSLGMTRCFVRSCGRKRMLGPLFLAHASEIGHIKFHDAPCTISVLSKNDKDKTGNTKNTKTKTLDLESHLYKAPKP